MDPTLVAVVLPLLVLVAWIALPRGLDERCAECGGHGPFTSYAAHGGKLCPRCDGSRARVVARERLRGGVRRRLRLVALAVFPPARRASRVRTAELEFAVGLREHPPRAWCNHCERRHCTGVEIVAGEGVWCPLGLTELCWHQENDRRAFRRRPSPAISSRLEDDEIY